MEITVEELQNKFDSLPEDMKWAIMGANVDDQVIRIGELSGLTVEQMGQLALETHAVMFGYTPTNMFESSVGRSLGLPPDKIKSIALMVNEKILKVIREKLQEFHKQESEETETSDTVDEAPAGDTATTETFTTNTAPQKEEETKEEQAPEPETLPEIEAPIPPVEETPPAPNPKQVEEVPIHKQVDSLSNNQKTIDSILSQKLSGTFKMNPSMTEYSLNNISKQDSKDGGAKKIDPYRLDPNE